MPPMISVANFSALWTSSGPDDPGLGGSGNGFVSSDFYMLSKRTTGGISFIDTVVDSYGDIYATGTYKNASNIIVIQLFKFTNAGNFLWAKTFTADPSISFANDTGLCLDDSGNVYISFFANVSLGNMVIIKFDPSGNISWKKKFKWDYGSGNCLSVTGSYLYVGATQGYFKLDLNGNYIYGKDIRIAVVGASGIDICTDSSGNLYRCIGTNDAYTYPNGPLLNVSKYSPTGTKLWSSSQLLNAYITASAYGVSTCVDEATKSLYVAAYFPYSAKVTFIWLSRYDTSRGPHSADTNPTWSISWSQPDGIYTIDLLLNDNGNPCLCVVDNGRTSKTPKTYIVEVDISGHVVRATQITSKDGMIAPNCVVMRNGKFYLCGYEKSGTTVDLFFAKMQPNKVVSTSDLVLVDQTINFLPNVLVPYDSNVSYVEKVGSYAVKGITEIIVVNTTLDQIPTIYAF